MYGARVKVVRKALNLVQTEFSKRLGISQNYLSQIESGAKEPSDMIIIAICREYHVSEDWLRTGEGEMFTRRTGAAAELVEKFNFSDITGKLLEAYERLTEDQQAAVLEYAHAFIVSLIEEDDIDRKVGSYREELLAEKTDASVSQNGSAGIA